MDPSNRNAKRYADYVRVQLGRQHHLTEQQERALLLEAIDMGLSIAEARQVITVTAANRHARRELALESDMAVTIAAFVGNKGWISRTGFGHATALYRRLSGASVSEAEARVRVKRLMLSHGWKMRGETIFGAPRWFRDIPAQPD